MTSKIDLKEVFQDHINTLRDNSTGRLSVWDLTVFYALPTLGGIVSFFLGLSIGDTGIGILISALSILAGLLINVLVLLYTVKEVGPTEKEAKRQVELIKEVNANLIYAITISILCIIMLCLLPRLHEFFDRAMTATILAILANFVLTLLMALKRLRVLLGLRFK